MNRKGFSARMRWLAPMMIAAVALISTAGILANTTEGEKALDPDLRSALQGALQAKINEMSKGSDKRGTFSKYFKPLEDGTYRGSMMISTVDENAYLLTRYNVILSGSGTDYKATAVEETDTWNGLSRVAGSACYPFDSLNFSEHGMTITAGKGSVCEVFQDGKVDAFYIHSPNLKYEYRAPKTLDFYTLQKLLEKDRADEIQFDPIWAYASCSPDQCERLLNESFTGLDRLAPDARTTAEFQGNPAGIDSKFLKEMERRMNERADERKDSPFRGFGLPYYDDNSTYNFRLFKNDDHSVWFDYDNWGGYEVQFGVSQRTTDPFALNGSLFGYYSDETMESSTQYDREERDDRNTRWFDLTRVKGTIKAALQDPEMMDGDINYGVRLKVDTNNVPFSIATIPRGSSDEVDRKPTLFVNSIRVGGEEATWVRTGQYSGMLILDEVLPAGTILDVDMNFSSRVLYKVNHAFTQVLRGGWLPFVRFGDFIDEMELTIHTPAQYKTLGIGRRVWDKRQGDVGISHWVADSPVVFPSIIFGKYKEGEPGFEAKKLDGTVIPVTVHVDEVSMMQLSSGADMRSGARGIRVKQLKPIAEQAANSINLYQEISGVDYPYGELNLVNDPAPALYGQAPSSLIYLGSNVFRGEGTMAGGSGGNSSGISKFLKSVTAHEVGHQWWGSAIANKNQRNYWFVESLAEYFSAIFLEAVYGADEYQEQVDDWRRTILTREQWTGVQTADTLWQGPSRGAARQAAIYNKGPYAFHILRKTFGDEKFFAFLKQFTQTLAKKGEIVTLDIQRAAEEAFGGIDPDGNAYNVDLGWFFDQWIRSAFLPQYKIDYDIRRNEEGKWLIEGTIKQRMVVGEGRNYEVAEDKKGNRGVASITVKIKGGEEMESRFLIDSAETPFRLVVPEKPLEVTLNKNGDLLSLDPVVNKSGWN